MRSLLGYLVWFFVVIPATLGGLIAVNRYFPELLGNASQEPATQVVPQPAATPTVTTNISDDIPSSQLPAESAAITYTTLNTYVTNTTSNPVTEKTVELDLDDISENRFLYVNDEKLKVFGHGNSGQVLQSTGSGLPEWVDLGTITTDWASPGAIGGTTANSAIFTQATLSGNSVPLIVGSSSDFQVTDAGRLELTYNGDSGYLSSSGGVIYINNTNNIGTGIGIYSNAAGDAQGNMINVKVDNPLYNQAAFYMNYDGISNAVEIINNSTDGSSNALAVTGNNINDSTLGIIGYELGKGTIKVSHYRPGSANDSSASGLSIDLKGSGTRAQGVYVDSTEPGGTLGNLLRLRNESIDKFVVNYQGNLTMAGNISQGAYGTDSTFTKFGNVTGDQFFIGTNAALRFQRSVGNSETFRTQIAGDANGRWVGTSDGRLRWGNGTDATDVALYRTAVGKLAIDGGLTINNLSADYDFVVKGMSDSNTFFVDVSSNNVGVGTSTPGFKLDVNGTGRFVGALRVDTLVSGATDSVITHSSGIFQQRSIDSRVWGSALVDGSGTANYLARWSDADTLTSSSMYDNGTNVGIGTSTNLNGKLTVHGNVLTTSQGDIFSQFDGDGNTTYPVFARYWDAHGTWPSTTFIFGNGTTSIVGIEKPGSTPVSLFQVRSNLSTFTGNVGIGTTTAGAPLHVFGGDIWLENTQALRIKDSGGSARSLLAYTSGNNVQLYNYASTGIVQIGINNASNTGSIRFFTNNNQERVRIDSAGLGVGATSFGTGAVNILAIASSTAPSTSITDGIQLFAVDEGGSHELRVRDEAGFVTTLSPHNFSILPDGMSENLAWSYYSERGGLAISADMTKALRLVEGMSGVRLVHVKDLQTGEYLESEGSAAGTSVAKSEGGWTEELKNYVSVKSLASMVNWDDSIWRFLSEAVFKARATFEKTAIFLADVQIFGKIKVGKDTAGSVTIPAGATAVTVRFSREYAAVPFVYLTQVGEKASGYSVTDVSKESFTVQLVEPSEVEVKFNWLAVIGEDQNSIVEAHFPGPTPSATPVPEVAGVATESAEIDVSAQEASPSAEASGSATVDFLE